MDSNGAAASGRRNGDELAVSIVVYHGAGDVLEKTIVSLRDAVRTARAAGLINRAGLVIVDNRAGTTPYGDLDDLIRRVQPCPCKIIRPERNLGYGNGHNLALTGGRSAYHLILNPDVIMDENAIARSIMYLRDHPRAGMVTPMAFYPSGQRQYLCKQYPSLLDLFIRGLVPQGIAGRYFHERMAKYEMRGITEERVNDAIQIAGGCFIFCRSEALAKAGGFSRNYFLYFEDFDFSLKMTEAGWTIAYVPSVRITHYGGHAARKGLVHLYHFVVSAVKFFQAHGWKLF